MKNHRKRNCSMCLMHEILLNMNKTSNDYHLMENQRAGCSSAAKLTSHSLVKSQRDLSNARKGCYATLTLTNQCH